jgi:hypothetical protein
MEAKLMPQKTGKPGKARQLTQYPLRSIPDIFCTIMSGWQAHSAKPQG